MISARIIARELLPYVVILWATFALLGGALETTQQSDAEGGYAVVGTGMGICAVTLACVAQSAMPRIRSLLRRAFSLSYLRAAFYGPLQPELYRRPLLTPPSLERLQILRI